MEQAEEEEDLKHMAATPVRHRKRLFAALLTALSLLTFSRLIFGLAVVTEAPTYDIFAWLGEFYLRRTPTCVLCC